MTTEQRRSCADCRYTAGQEGGSLTCQRYPQPYRVARSYLCGEYKALVEEKPAEPKPRGLRARLAISEPPTVTRADIEHTLKPRQ